MTPEGREACWYFMSDSVRDHDAAVTRCQNLTSDTAVLAYIDNGERNEILTAIINQ